MKYKLKIARVRGIPVNIHISFIVIFILFSVYLSIQSFTIFGIRIGFGGAEIPALARWSLGTLTALVLFSFLFLHELAHSLVSISHGYKVKEITFFILGGVSNSEKFPKDPTLELKIAGVGPLVSLGIGGVSLLAERLLSFLGPASGDPIFYVGIFLGSVGFYNIIIGIFNLIPAFPLDGGRILRSFLGYRMDHRMATIKAGQVGKVMAVAMGIAGILVFNLILVFIAVFIYLGAKTEMDMTRTMESLKGLKMKEMISSKPAIIDADEDLQEAQRMMIRKRKVALIVRKNGSLKGVVTADEIGRIPRESRTGIMVGDIISGEPLKAGPTDDASRVWEKMVKKGRDNVVVTGKGGILGLATRNDFMDMLKLKSFFN